MSNKSNGKLPSKKAKPSKDWPFFWHRSGTWARKIRGRLVYFSADKETALELW